MRKVQRVTTSKAERSTLPVVLAGVYQLTRPLAASPMRATRRTAHQPVDDALSYVIELNGPFLLVDLT